MTESNKQRVVRYWNILLTMDIRTFESIAEQRYTSATYSRAFVTAVRCAIAEVEAIITEMSKSYNEWNLTDLQSELTELKQLLV